MKWLDRLIEWTGWNEPYREHRCPHCDALLIFDIKHECRGVSKDSIRRIISEELDKRIRGGE